MTRILLRQFTSPIMMLLIGATLLSIVVGEGIDSFIILVIVLISGLLGFLQEWRADQTMAELSRMVAVHADVRRGDLVVEVPVDEVVVGDVVVLRAGDIIPADLRLTSAVGLLVDESAVTGESLPVDKGSLEENATLPSDMAFLGTHVVSGEGEGIVEAIGGDTRFGGVIRHIAADDVVTSFERSMRRFGFLLTEVMAVLVAVVLVIQTLAERPVFESLMFALALAVGITPQMLPAIVMVSLSSGARRMAAEEMLIRRLDVIEDIGAMTMLCTDKTGTLTGGELALVQAVDERGVHSDRVLEMAAINASLQTSYANPLDQAISKRRPTSGLALGEVPYDFTRRRISVLADTEEGRLIITKGAVEQLLACCDDSVDRGAVREMVTRWESDGLRVLAVATRPADQQAISTADEVGMSFAGLLAFEDPPTEQAALAIGQLRALGVDVCVISGDGRHVTAAVARQVGLDTDDVLTGSVVEALSESDLGEAVRECRIFAEVQPLQKERLVRAFQSQGHTVGFLGDGINDVAALRSADVGISVQGAADVAKQSAAMVIMSKSLEVVCDATLMGRRTFANTLKYIRVTISANFGNVLSMVVASLFLPFLPMLPIQILLLNLLSDAPALAIAGDRVDEQDLAKPQFWSMRQVRRFMITFGLVSSVIDICLFLLLRGWLSVGAATFHTAWFLLSLFTEVAALLALRSGLWILSTRPATGLVVISTLTFLASLVLVFSGLGRIVGLVPLSLGVGALLLFLGVLYVALNEAMKKGLRAATA